MKKIRTGTGQPTDPAKTLGCYHAGSRSLNRTTEISAYSLRSVFIRVNPWPTGSRRSIIPTHARQPDQRAVDRAILQQSPASHQSCVPHLWHSYHSGLSGSRSRRILLPSLVDLRGGTVRAGMDPPVRRPCVRRQAPGIFQRLAIPFRRRPLVVGEDQRKSLRTFVQLCKACPISRVFCEKACPELVEGWGFGLVQIPRLALVRDCVLCSPNLRVRIRATNMQRLTARFLLLFALVGTFVPLALAATAAPLHSCCLRKAAHQCHGVSNAAGNEADQRAIRGTGCCNHDCCRALTTSQSADAQPPLAPVFAPNVESYAAAPDSRKPTTNLFASQSARAPPRISLA